jgi:conjugal transfer/entry exclusion protein
LFQSKADANRDFERCVSNISTTSTTNLFKKQKKDQEKVLTNLSGIQTQYVNLTDEVKRYTTDVSMIVQDYTNQINVLEDAQDNSNKLSNTAINKVDTFLSNITNIFDNISGYLLK